KKPYAFDSIWRGIGKDRGSADLFALKASFPFEANAGVRAHLVNERDTVVHRSRHIEEVIDGVRAPQRNGEGRGFESHVRGKGFRKCRDIGPTNNSKPSA